LNGIAEEARKGLSSLRGKAFRPSISVVSQNSPRNFALPTIEKGFAAELILALLVKRYFFRKGT